MHEDGRGESKAGGQAQLSSRKARREGPLWVGLNERHVKAALA